MLIPMLVMRDVGHRVFSQASSQMTDELTVLLRRPKLIGHGPESECGREPYELQTEIAAKTHPLYHNYIGGLNDEVSP